MSVENSKKFTKRIEIKCIISRLVEEDKKEFPKYVQSKEGKKEAWRR